MNCAKITPVSDGLARPRWSVLIPTFNCAQFLEETLLSVLGQDPGADKMEIIVVDDHSITDDPEEVVSRLGRGRVRFIRQDRNVGKVRNFETGLDASRGYLIHQLHGDDRLRPGFYSAMDAAFDAFPVAGAFFCESLYIDERGRVIGKTGKERPQTGLLDDWLEKIVVDQRIQTPSMVLRRSVYESLGAFDRRLNMAEDWEMWIRVATAFRVGFSADALADYRVSSSGATAIGVLNGDIARETRAMISIVDSYLPPDVLTRCGRRRSQGVAQSFIQFIPALMAGGKYMAVGRIYRDVLSFSVHPRTMYRLVYFTLNYRRFATKRDCK